MALITITFTEPINVSVQKGDMIYYVNPDNLNQSSNIIEMGLCESVTEFTLVCNIPNSVPRPTSTSFIMFSKDMRANTSGLTGYFAEVEMKNNSNTYAEMFAVSSEVVQSSK
tara:strand:- start:295 stop:630 length:336 start_codon:yes stop_codon:yes gene_type:complete